MAECRSGGAAWKLSRSSIHGICRAILSGAGVERRATTFQALALKDCLPSNQDVNNIQQHDESTFRA